LPELIAEDPLIIDAEVAAGRAADPRSREELEGRARELGLALDEDIDEKGLWLEVHNREDVAERKNSCAGAASEETPDASR